VTAGIRTPKRGFRLPEVLSVDEITRIIETAPTLRDRLLIGLMYGCGLRVSEVCALRWKDFDVTRQLLTVTSARGTRTRQLPIPLAFTELLSLGVKQCAGDDHIFPGATPGKPLSTRAIERHLAGIAKAADIPRTVSCTVLRHSYAVECLRSGMTVQELRQNLGHKHVRTTMLYRQCILPTGVISPADGLYVSKPVPNNAQTSDSDFRILQSTSRIPHPESSPHCSLFSTHTVYFVPPPLPFPTIPAGHQGFFAMLKTRIRNRFLAIKDYINTT
jgi:hypothetical protein